MRRGRDEQAPNTEDRAAGKPAVENKTDVETEAAGATKTAVDTESAESGPDSRAAGGSEGSVTRLDALRRVPRKALLGASAVVVVALAVVVGLLLAQRTTGWPLHPELKTTALEQARTEAVQAASDSAVALLSYDHTTVDDELRSAAERTTGSFRDDYTKITTTTVAPAAKQKAVTTRATVVGAAASTASTDKVDTLVYLNQSTTTQDAPAPTQSGSRLVLTMEKVDGRWLVSAMNPV